MRKRAWLIACRADAYRFGQATDDAEMRESPGGTPDAVETLAAALREAGYAGEPTVLAIPSSWCLPTQVALASRRLTRNRQAVAFALEEQLPISAEDLVFDSLTHDTQVFGVTADTRMLLPLVRSLEEAGIQLVSLTPIAFLLLEQLDRRRELPRDGLVLMSDGEVCNLFEFKARRPVRWQSMPHDAAIIARDVGAWLLARDDDEVGGVTLVNVSEAGSAAIRALLPEVTVHQLDLPLDGLLLHGVRETLVHGKRPWIELRREPLGAYDPYRTVRGSLRYLAAAVLVALLALTATAWMRAEKYRVAAAELDQRKQELFRELFPGARVPGGIRSRLESEHRTLQGMVAGATQTPELRAVTGPLVAALSGLPADLRFRLLDIRMEETSGYLQGEVQRLGDIDPLINALRERGFQVEPPRTEALATEGVSFTLNLSTAQPAEAESRTAAVAKVETQTEVKK